VGPSGNIVKRAIVSAVKNVGRSLNPYSDVNNPQNIRVAVPKAELEQVKLQEARLKSTPPSVQALEPVRDLGNGMVLAGKNLQGKQEKFDAFDIKDRVPRKQGGC
jgi:hypothetical protein